MKVILRIQKGIVTKAIDVPENCVRTDYRVPIHRPMVAKFIGEIQDMASAFPENKQLIFKWDRTSTWGNSAYPIMDLVDIH